MPQFVDDRLNEFLQSDGGSIAHLGPSGSFSHEVCSSISSRVRPEPRRTFGDVIDAVVTQNVDYGLIPIYNTIAGQIIAGWSALLDSGVIAVGAYVHRISLALLAREGSTLSTIRRVVSHSAALRQSSHWQRRMLIGAQVSHSTAAGAALVSRTRSRELAAIGSPNLADRYNLSLVAHDIANDVDNETTFLLIQRQNDTAATDNKFQRTSQICCPVSPNVLLSRVAPEGERANERERLRSQISFTCRSGRALEIFLKNEDGSTNEKLIHGCSVRTEGRYLGHIPVAATNVDRLYRAFGFQSNFLRDHFLGNIPKDNSYIVIYSRVLQ